MEIARLSIAGAALIYDPGKSHRHPGRRALSRARPQARAHLPAAKAVSHHEHSEFAGTNPGPGRIRRHAMGGLQDLATNNF